MKITSTENIKKGIVAVAEVIARQYFSVLPVEVLLYQSSDLALESDEGEEIPACIVPKEDILPFSACFPQLEEIESFFNEKIRFIIWLGQSVENSPQEMIIRVIAHELKHVEQIVISPRSALRSKALFCFGHIKISRPSEIDADNFAKKVAGLGIDNNYSWEHETDILFEQNREFIKKVYEELKLNRNGFVANPLDSTNGFEVYSLCEEKKRLCMHFFEKVL